MAYPQVYLGQIPSTAVERIALRERVLDLRAALRAGPRGRPELDPTYALLNFAAEGSYSLVVDLERVVPVDSGTVDVPIVQPLGVERSKGFVGIQALGNLELTPDGVVGAAPVDVRTLPATIVGVTDQPVSDEPHRVRRPR